MQNGAASLSTHSSEDAGSGIEQACHRSGIAETKVHASVLSLSLQNVPAAGDEREDGGRGGSLNPTNRSTLISLKQIARVYSRFEWFYGIRCAIEIFLTSFLAIKTDRASVVDTALAERISTTLSDDRCTWD